MRVDVVPVGDLSPQHERLWRELRTTHRAYASPFYSLDFVRIAARSRPCFVAVIEDAGRVVGFWAFERHRGAAAPVGHPGSDHHGPLVPMDWQPSQALALRAPRWIEMVLPRWLRSALVGSPAQSLLGATEKHLHRFTALPAEQRLWQGYHRSTEGSPIVVLDRYEHAKTNSNSNLGRKLRRLEREIGPWRFDADCTDTAVLDQLIAWKRAHCQRTGFPDFGEDPARIALFRDLFEARTPEFRGMLSALWAGDKPIAAHFGPLSPRVWHWWIPSYDTDLERHSPGLIMLHKMLAHAPDMGVEWLDFGTGAESFKWEFGNDEIRVASGTVYSPLAAAPIAAKQLLNRARRWPALSRQQLSA